MTRKLFVTTALPYANGPFHIGHIMEYIQADIWVRFQRMQGHEVHFICADDAHGAPIMIAAEKAGLTPQEFIAQIAAGRKPYLDGFHIGFDHWYSTDGADNHALSKDIYCRLRDQAKLITTKTVEQFFDPVKNMFLPDRYIKGNCPQCGSADQYGDACEVCSAVYNATELRNPYSTLSGAAPILKSSEHFFFQLSDPRCIEFLRAWTQDGKLQPEVANKVKEWLGPEKGLGDWDISRDAPYFGIEIPDAPGKYFYVWLDAPVGYLSALKNYFDQGKALQQAGNSQSFSEFMADPATEQYHFIGKDITYFHTLFWPAMLHFSGAPYRVPTNVFVHGFITVSGEKMSKSRGTGISPLRYLEIGMNPEWLRYYIAAKLNNKVEDVDFNANDFLTRVNADLVGKYINLASRAAGFLHKEFAGELYPIDETPTPLENQTGSRQLLQEIWTHADSIQQFYNDREYAKALREIMRLADRANEFWSQHKPWELAKQLPVSRDALQLICTVAIEYFRMLTIYLKPVLPQLAQRAENFLQLQPQQWHDVSPQATSAFSKNKIGQYSHLMTRIEPKMLESLFERE